MTITPQQLKAVRFVHANPGCMIRDVSRALGFKRSVRHGYPTVHRAIRAGLLRAERSRRRRYALTSTPYGQMCAQLALWEPR